MGKNISVFDKVFTDSIRSYTKAHSTPYLQVGTGQRYSLILNTPTSPEKSQYYIQIESRERPTVTIGYAVLNYGSKPAIAPSPPRHQSSPFQTPPTTSLNMLCLPSANQISTPSPPPPKLPGALPSASTNTSPGKQSGLKMDSPGLNPPQKNPTLSLSIKTTPSNFPPWNAH